MSDLLMTMTAELSACGMYRWLLTRTWDPKLPVLIFIMLNPSTADAAINDATIRVCMGRTQRMGYGGIVVMNLFAYRTTHPSHLAGVIERIGQDNDVWLRKTAQYAERGAMIIAAWGDGGLMIGRKEPRWRDVTEILCGELKLTLHCLGMTQIGQPRHPLRIAYALRPTEWMTPKSWQAIKANCAPA